MVGGVFSSCVEAVELRLSDSDDTLVFILHVSPNAPVYSRTLHLVFPNIGNEFKRFSVEADDIMTAIWLLGTLKADLGTTVLIQTRCLNVSCKYCLAGKAGSDCGTARRWVTQQTQ